MPHAEPLRGHLAEICLADAPRTRASRRLSVSVGYAVLAHATLGAMALWLAAGEAPPSRTLLPAVDATRAFIVELETSGVGPGEKRARGNEAAQPPGEKHAGGAQAAQPPGEKHADGAQAVRPDSSSPPPRVPAAPHPERHASPEPSARASIAATSVRTARPAAAKPATTSTAVEASEVSPGAAPVVAAVKEGAGDGAAAVAGARDRNASGAGSGFGGGEHAAISYRQLLVEWLERHKLYPSRARALGMEADIVVRIAIARDGRVRTRNLERRAPFSLLNGAVEDMVDRSNPFPPVPPSVPGAEFEFSVPVSFKLTGTASDD